MNTLTGSVDDGLPARQSAGWQPGPGVDASPPSTEPIRIGLALGGGAVRGAAHIGVLAALDEAGMAPAVLAGTSAGAIVGALYAAGISPTEIGVLARTLRWTRLVHPSMNRHSLLDTSPATPTWSWRLPWTSTVQRLVMGTTNSDLEASSRCTPGSAVSLSGS